MPIHTCHCTTECKNSARGCDDRRAEYTGVVLAVTEENGYHDSDFVAIVWDAQEGRVRRVTYASTAYWSYHDSATVDATPDVQAQARAWAEQRVVAAETSKAQRVADELAVGRRVRSTTGRGKNVGVEGVVKWLGADRYRRDGIAVGVAVAGEPKLRYLSADRVAVVDTVPVDVDAVTAQVRARWSWASASRQV